MDRVSRRNVLAGAAAAGLTVATKLAWPLTPARSKFRFVHFSDLHIQPELGASDGVNRAIAKVNSLHPKPDFVLTGGDHVMDLLEASQPRADVQFKLLDEALRHLEMPWYATVGNHDIYGWSEKSEALATDPLYGKGMFEEHVAKAPIYRSFDHRDWHFVILDSLRSPKPRDWDGAIDDNQLSWLKSDLDKAAGRPSVILTHIPALTLVPQYVDGTLSTPNSKTVLANGKELKELIQGKNVKAVLQGHTHVVEECEYLGTHYITGGAVCGDWWKGWRLGVHPEGFMVYDVDGDQLRWQYVTYGWKARA